MKFLYGQANAEMAEKLLFENINMTYQAKKEIASQFKSRT